MALCDVLSKEYLNDVNLKICISGEKLQSNLKCGTASKKLWRGENKEQ